MQKNQGGDRAAATKAIAQAFVNARAGGRALNAYPGAAPQSLAAAYAIQNEAISLWPDEVAGWKVGRITGDAESKFGCDRLAGPIFTRMIAKAGGKPAETPVFAGGFAAVEAECVLVMGDDAPADKMHWSLNEAKEMIGGVAAGIEIASSPFSGVNDLGPAVTISDFGNNNGLIIGAEIPDWRSFDIEQWCFATLIDGKVIAESNAGAIPGGPVESLRFLLENAAQRGMPLAKGMVISSGAVTGVHEARIGETATVRFEGLPSITCTLVAAKPAKHGAILKNREATA